SSRGAPVAASRTIRSRESVGYGRTWRAARGTRVGVVPVGYADGYARALGGGAEGLVRGRRGRGARGGSVMGAASRDQLPVDLGPDSGDEVGDEAVLLGSQDGERVSAEELAAARGSINYEVTCAIGARIPRVHEE